MSSVYRFTFSPLFCVRFYGSTILPPVSAPSLTETLAYTARQKGPYQQLMRSRVNPDESALIRDHIVRPVRNDDRDIFLAMKPGDRYIDIDPAYQRYSTASFADKYYKLLPDAPCVTITAHKVAPVPRLPGGAGMRVRS